MSGRGARLFFFPLTLLLCLGGNGFAAPALRLDAPLPAAADHRLCQDQNGAEVDYSRYFTTPERDEKQQITFVFYNNIITPAEVDQFGYALFYGLEFAAEKADADDLIAVGIYFTNDTGKIYLIAKKDFDAFHRQKLTVEALLKHLTVKEVDLGKGMAVGPSVKK